jgi:two-component system sensor histidine kinase UhpB
VQPARGPGKFGRFFFFTPFRALVIMVVAIFVAEIGDMFLLTHLAPLPRGVEALIDAAFLLVMLSPAYCLIYRPFCRLWDERQRSEEEVRHLSQRLIEAVEAERQHIARELHDEFGQVLTALQFSMETLGRTLPEESSEARTHLRRIVGLLTQLGNHVRHVSGALRPVLLDDMGLEAALRSHVDQFAGLHPDLQIDIAVDVRQRRLPPAVNLALFRICQESLNNAARHARARRVDIRLTYAPRKVELTVEDDGVGFDPEEVRRRSFRSSGIGLLGMRERAAALGGRLQVVSAKGRGTTIGVELPVPPE